jgi:hypothetical protein
MKFTKHFSKFLQDCVNLNQTRLDELDGHVKALHDYLDGHTDFGDILIDMIPQGSWAHKTIVKPKPDKEFDADVLLEIEKPEAWEPADYVSQLWRAFRDSGVYRPKVSRKARCVRVQYAGECHVDVVPFIRSSLGGQITNREDNAFESTDPEGFTAWFKERNDLTEGHLKRVIRLVKYLRNYKAVFSIKSVILTTLLAERVSSTALQTDPACYADVPSTLTTLMLALADHLDAHDEPPTVVDPSNTDSTFDHRWDPDTYPNLQAKIRFYADKIAAAYDEEDQDNSMALWREVFGTRFGYDPVTQTAAKERRAPGEEFLDEHRGIAVPTNRPHSVKVTCTVEEKQGFRAGDLARLRHRVQKERTLLFDATTDTPPPYEAYWKVRNSGNEAQARGELRGEITRDDGNLSKTETTRYRGSHWVECYIVKNGECVAATRYPVRVI